MSSIRKVKQHLVNARHYLDEAEHFLERRALFKAYRHFDLAMGEAYFGKAGLSDKTIQAARDWGHFVIDE